MYRIEIIFSPLVPPYSSSNVCCPIMFRYFFSRLTIYTHNANIMADLEKSLTSGNNVNRSENQSNGWQYMKKDWFSSSIVWSRANIKHWKFPEVLTVSLNLEMKIEKLYLAKHIENSNEETNEEAERDLLSRTGNLHSKKGLKCLKRFLYVLKQNYRSINDINCMLNSFSSSLKHPLQSGVKLFELNAQKGSSTTNQFHGMNNFPQSNKNFVSLLDWFSWRTKMKTKWRRGRRHEEC